MGDSGIIDQIRSSYIHHFTRFTARARKKNPKGSPEVIFKLQSEGLFKQLYRVDFVNVSDDGPEAVELIPDTYPKFEPCVANMGRLEISIQSMTWDDVRIEHNASCKMTEGINDWFYRWFDPEDQRYDGANDMGNFIHNLMIADATLSVDFGTADSDAFFELLAVIEASGGTRATIMASRIVEEEAEKKKQTGYLASLGRFFGRRAK